jgi:membrane protein
MLGKLLSTPTAQLGRASRFLVFQIKLWSHCIRLLIKNRSGQQAAALSYHTVFGIVPLAIVMLLIFQWFPAYSGVGDKVRAIVYEQLELSTIEYPDPANPEENVMLTEYLDEMVGGFFSGLNEGEIALFSAVIVIWAALALLSTIERAFNNIWHVARGRSFLQRIINYWALLTLGPLLLGVGVYASAQYAALARLQETVLSNITPAVFSYFVATVVFFLLYFVLPNTRVRVGAALWGAAVAALAWSFAKWGFGVYVTKFIPYSQIYGVLGLIPLGVFWIFATWLIVLFGLQLTYTTQHLSSLDAAEIAAATKTEEHFVANDITAINIVREIAAAFERNQAPVSSEIVCSKLNMPAELADKILNHFVERGLLAKTSEPRVGFVPVKDPAGMALSDISAALAEIGFAQTTPDSPEALEQLAQSQRKLLARYNLGQMLDVEQQG